MSEIKVLVDQQFNNICLNFFNGVNFGHLYDIRLKITEFKGNYFIKAFKGEDLVFELNHASAYDLKPFVQERKYYILTVRI